MSIFMKIGNSFIRLILSSPFHKLFSKNTLLIHFTGRKSGRLYTTPVNYTQEEDIIRITSRRERTWWRNLKTQPEILLTLRGKLVGGGAKVLEEPSAAAEGIADFLRPAPQLARYYQIGISHEGGFKSEDLIRAAQDRVVIEIVMDK